MGHVHGRAIVLLEGLDKTGKTSAAAMLAAELGRYGPVRREHFGVPAPGADLMSLYSNAILDASSFEGSTIIDRLHWSDEAYSQTFRGGAELTPQQLTVLDALLTSAGAVVVFRTRPLGEIVRALDADDYPPRDLAKLVQLESIFRARYNHSECLRAEIPFPHSVGDILPQAAESRTAVK